MPPSVQKQMAARPQVWHTGLFGCTSDDADCCYGCFCLPCLWGQNNIHFFPAVKDSCGPTCKYFMCCPCACLFAPEMRRAIRTKYNLAEHPCNDCCVHCFCGPCAVCQEAREIKHMQKVDPKQSYKAPPSQGIKTAATPSTTMATPSTSAAVPLASGVPSAPSRASSGDAPKPKRTGSGGSGKTKTKTKPSQNKSDNESRSGTPRKKRSSKSSAP